MSALEVTILIVVVLVNFILAGVAYRRNPQSATNRLFALLTLVMSLYLVSNFLAVNSKDEVQALWFIRTVMFFAAPMSVLFFFFIHTFPHTRIQFSGLIKWTWIILTITTMAIALSPYLFTHVKIISSGPPQPMAGPGMALFALTGVFTIPLGIYYLIKKFRAAGGIEKIQLRFILFGVTLMFAAILTLILGGTVLFSNSIFAQYAPLFTVPFVGLTSYVMLRHRLMDVKGAIFRSLSFTFLLGAFFLLYAVLLIFAVPIVSRAFSIPAEMVAAVGALVAVLISKYVQSSLARATDKFLFKNRVDYKKALVTIGQDLSGTIDISEVSDIILKAMKETLRSRKVIIFLREEEGLKFVPYASFGAGQFNISIPSNQAIIKEIEGHQTVIIKDEEQVEIETETSPYRIQQEEAVLNAFEWLDASAAVALFVNKQLTGVILLGEKLSGDPYLQDDTEFLSALAPQAATALENARLYKDAQEFNVRLKRENEEATSELAQANIQLKNLDKAKSEFLSIASHQLYTPLTALRGYVSMMQDGDFGKIPEKQVPVLDILEKSATRLIELIKNLLDISRIESGRLELKLESVDLSQMAKELVADLMPNAINKNLDLEFHQAATLPKNVVADQQRLRQVMLNFVDNAIKYTPSGKIDVYVYQEGEFIIFSVKDTGKGIKKDEIAQLFNKFSRVGGASRFHTEGTGLGLYVARQIVREHHGEVHVDSPGEGQGSTFTLQMPVEGTGQSLKVGEHASVVIKAAEAQAVE